MKVKKVAGLLIVALIALRATALAQPMVFARTVGGPLPMPLMMIIKQLNLSQDQQAKVHEIMASNFAQTQPLMKQLQAVHEQIADKLMSPGTVGASDLSALQQQESQIQQQLDNQMLSAALQIRDLLTTDQLNKAAALHEKLKSLRQQMDALVGEMGPPGPPPGL